MAEVEQFLQTSERLYSHLTNIPLDEERTAFIDQINILLDEREESIQALGSTVLSEHSLYDHLLELDQGINKRLSKVMNDVKRDIKDLQQKKRHEGSYSNPYAATQTIDGMYFDNKK
ncbi:flagellar protein FliT [Psychrobacillus sp. FSL H8-0483]|uniref:flagellar protein FliT n=1 Tax=Psychrobacillus sp. FSL H8-0483 TaxID=2921389 RepID=UPI00315A14AF